VRPTTTDDVASVRGCAPLYAAGEQHRRRFDGLEESR
jgi:hypothetical protein